MRGILSIVGMCALVWAGFALPVEARMTFEKPAVAQPKKVTRKTTLSDRNKPLQKALEVHNLINKMVQVRNVQTMAQDVSHMSDKVRDALVEMEKCNVAKLSQNFKNPDEVWGKMVSSYEEREKTAPIYMPQSVQEYLDVGAEQMHDDTYAFWKTGRDVLVDVYSNPGAWGERKNTPDATFPVWEDQKHFQDQEWNKKYEAVNAFFGVDAAGRPDISDAVRHDYTQYDQVKMAHVAYLQKLAGNDLTRVRDLPIDIAAPPVVAPRPLPPVEEAFIVEVMETGDLSVLPEVPVEWQEMVQKGDFNSGGELAKMVEKAVNTELEDQVSPTNRISAYVELKRQVSVMDKSVQATASAQNKISQDFNRSLRKYKLNRDDLDLGNASHYVTIQDALKKLKQQYIEEATLYAQQLEEQYANNPKMEARRQKRTSAREKRLERVKDIDPAIFDALMRPVQNTPVEMQRIVLAALEKDKNAVVYLTETNAYEIDKYMKEAMTRPDYVSDRSKWEKDVLKKMEFPLDESCTIQDA